MQNDALAQVTAANWTVCSAFGEGIDPTDQVDAVTSAGGVLGLVFGVAPAAVVVAMEASAPPTASIPDNSTAMA
jgi:hypothetical protein